MTPEFDIIIVGSGPAGVSAAFPLVESGLKVLMVDGGRNSNIMLPEKSFLSARAEDANQWKWMIGKNFHALQQMQEVVSPKLKAPTHEYVFDGFGAANQIKSQEFLTVGSLATGGLSNAWGCSVACLSASELTHFPFNAIEIERSYEIVTKRIGVSGRQDDDLSEYFGLDAWAQPPIPKDALNTHLYKSYTKQRDSFSSKDFRLGRARLAVLSEDHLERKACNRSGSCLWGCSRHSMYSASDEMLLLRKFKNFHYEGGFIVDGLVRSGDCWAIEGQKVTSGVQRKISARKVFLAAGTLASSRLVLKTLAIKPSLSLLACPTAAFLLWMPRFLGSPREPSFGLGQLSFSLAIKNDINGFGSTFSTTGIPVSEFARYLPLGRRYAIDVLGSLMSSCLVGNIFLPGQLSDANVTLKKDGSLSVSGVYRDEVSSLFKVTAKKLRSAYRKLGGVLLPMSFTVGRPGSDIHYAGTLPMRLNPVIGETNSMGEIFGMEGVHAVDGASLSILTEKPHTLTIMANADRIARQVTKNLSRNLDFIK